MRVPSPALVLAFLGAAPLFAGEGASVGGKVQFSEDGQARRTVVYLEGSGLDASPPADGPDLMQRGKQFAPDFLAVQKGTAVDFPNEDRVFHNVFSLKPGFQFDLGLYKKGESKSFTFDRVGTTDVYCNIHPDMFATLVVVPNRFFTRPAEDGSFTIRDVPPGDYEVVAQASLCAPARTKVTVGVGAEAQVTLEIPARSHSREHKKKDGSDYGRYK